MKNESTEMVHNIQAEEEDSLASRINIERFSNWNRLGYVTAPILKLYSRFASNGDKNTEWCPLDLNKA